MRGLPIQKTSVPFMGGMSTKVDRHQIPFHKLAMASDVVFTTPGEARTRYGYRALSTAGLGDVDRFTPSGDPPPITTGQALMAYGNELVLCDALNLYSWDPGQNGWVLKAPCTSMAVTTEPVVQDNYGQSAADEAIAANGIRVDVWEDSRGGSYFSATDTATGTPVVNPTLLDLHATKPKVLQMAGVFCLLYVRTDTARLYMATAPAANVFPGFFNGVPITSASVANIQLNASNANYDATVMETNAGLALYVAFDNNVSAGGAGITLYGYTPDNLTTAKYGPLVVASLVPLALTVFADTVTATGPNAINGPAVAFSTGTRVKVFAYDYSLTAATLGLRTIDTTTSVVPTLTGISLPVAGLSTRAMQIYFTVFATDSDKTHVMRGFVAGTIAVTATVFKRSVGLAAKAFRVSQGGRFIGYVPLAYQSQYPTADGVQGIQDTYFVCDSSGYIVARFFSGTAGGLPGPSVLPPVSDYGWPMLPEVSQSSDTVFRCALTSADFLTTFSTTTPAPGTDVPLTAVFTQDGVQSCVFDFFNHQTSYLRAQLGQTLLIGGGLLQSYDGQTLTENDFNLFPENITLTPSTTVDGGLTLLATYFYVFVFQWRNRRGELQQSAPSIPISITLTGTDNTVTATIPTLRLTAKEGLTILAFRAISTGTVYQQAVTTSAPAASGATNAPILNSTTTDTVTFVDELSDDDLAANPNLYTTGDVIENSPTPPCSDLTVNFSRLFALGTDGTIWFSQQNLPGQPVQMSEWLFTNVDARGGKTVAIRAFEQHTIVFKEDLIMAIDGAGPDRTGQGGFGPAYLVTTDTGCIYPRSITRGKDGLYFQGAKGIYLLERDLTVTYIGVDAEGLIQNEEITSAQLIPYTQQMRFTLGNGTLVGHDYLVHQWFQHTGINAVDAVIWQGSYCYLQPDGKVMQETAPTRGTTYEQAMQSFSDDGRFVGMQLVTPWYDLAGLNGWQCTWWVYVLGKVFSACTLRVDIAYDYDPSIRQTVYIQIGPGTAYGTGVYGKGVYGGAVPDSVFRVQPNQMMSSALQLTLTVQQRGPTTGESLSLSGLTFEWGAERTGRLTGNSASYG